VVVAVTTVAPGVKSAQPASRNPWQRFQHWLHADLPRAAWRKKGEKPPPHWYLHSAIRKAWLWRDITPGPLAALTLWIWARIPFGPTPPHIPAAILAVAAAAISAFTIWLDADHGRTANADRTKHKAKRRWQKACLDADIDHIPALLWVTHKGHVTLLGIEAVEGTDDYAIYRKASRRLGTIYRKKVNFHPNDDGSGVVAIHHYDPLADEPALPTYLGNLNGPEIEPTWKALPIGVDRDGTPFTVSMFEKHLLVVGQSGSGKSSSLNPLICTCIAAEHVEPWAIDPADVSFRPFRNAIPYAGTPDTGLDLLRDFHTSMEKREAKMAEADLSLAWPSAHWPLRILFIDELLSIVDPDLMPAKFVTDFNGLLKDTLRRGRKTGHSLVCTATDPRANLLVDGFRSGFHYRLCFKVATGDDSLIALGKYRVVAGYKPHELPDLPGRAVFTGAGFHQLRTWRFWDGATRKVVDSLSATGANVGQDLVPTTTSQPTTPIQDLPISPTDGSSTTRPPVDHRRRIFRFLQDRGPHKVSEISTDLNIPKTTVRYYLLDKRCRDRIPVQAHGGGRYGLIGDQR
jgi:S-DNA-T family DNA segregation ATPase FtsK/SpoIIIE